MKKIIYITGAFGFIGRNSAKFFNDKGWYVVGAGLGQWAGEEFRDWGIQEWHPGLITKELLLSINKKPDVVLHCAGGSSVGFSVENPEKDFEITVESARNVLEFMRLKCPEARLIYPSSVAVYGQKEDTPIKESDALNPVSPYGLHKKIVEELCKDYSEKYNINVSVVRLFSAYGPGLRKQLIWDASCKICSGEKEIKFFGTGLETRDWIHVADVASLFLFLAGSDRKFEILNGATGIRLTVRSALETLEKEFGTNVKILFNNIAREGDPKYFHADISKIRALGWAPKISFCKGIAGFVNNFKNKNND